MILRAVCGLGIVAAMAGAFARTLDRHAGSADGAPAPTIDGGTDPGRSDFGRIAVRGLARWELDALRRAGLSAREWNEVLAVRVAGAESTPGLPPVMGQHRISDGAVEFVPRFRPPIGVRYSVRFDRGRIGPLAGRQTEAGPMVVTRDLTFGESAPPAPATVVTAIHPSSDVVPANQLRWYLEFSAPMSLGEAYRRVRLLDERGREVSGAFLVVDQELWDPARRRLTLLFDPGRVKRGIRPNLESGAPIRQGGTYTLRVDAAWRDGRGAPLRSGFAR
ncbi:MAG TPA: hypothetical protein VNK43_10115, partial [Gemmatimonadales bacterium]|nr:hypothetical protein [Gemmatimonadales bacterium]